MHERHALLDHLKRLTDTQFKELLFQLKVPLAYLPPDTAERINRAIKLIEWLESQDQLVSLHTALDALPHESATPQSSAHSSFKQSGQQVGTQYNTAGDLNVHGDVIGHDKVSASECAEQPHEEKPADRAPNPFGMIGTIRDAQQALKREWPLQEALALLKRGSNIAVLGDSGLGKSTFLHQIQHYGAAELNATAEQFLFLNMLEPDEPSDFFELFAEAQ